MTIFRKADLAELSNPGVVSRQLLTPDSTPEARVTLTEVRLDPGAVQPRHVHEASEQIWYAVRGDGQPAHPKECKNTQNKYQYLPCFHNSLQM